LLVVAGDGFKFWDDDFEGFKDLVVFLDSDVEVGDISFVFSSNGNFSLAQNVELSGLVLDEALEVLDD